MLKVVLYKVFEHRVSISSCHPIRNLHLLGYIIVCYHQRRLLAPSFIEPVSVIPLILYLEARSRFDYQFQVVLGLHAGEEGVSTPAIVDVIILLITLYFGIYQFSTTKESSYEVEVKAPYEDCKEDQE